MKNIAKVGKYIAVSLIGLLILSSFVWNAYGLYQVYANGLRQQGFNICSNSVAQEFNQTGELKLNIKQEDGTIKSVTLIPNE